MKKIYYLIFVLLFLCSNDVKAQFDMDSLLLEQAFRHNNVALADSMFKKWSKNSLQRTHSNLNNDTVKLVYNIYTRFMKDFIHANSGFPKEEMDAFRRYIFIQNKIQYIVIHGLNSEDFPFHSSKKREENYTLSLLTRDYILNARTHHRQDIFPFYPNLKNIYTQPSTPKLIYIKESNHCRLLVHFLGYQLLTPHTSLPFRKNRKRKKRREFLNKVLHFNLEKRVFLDNFRFQIVPHVQTIFIDKHLRFAMVVYYMAAKRTAYLAFYPMKLLQSDHGYPYIAILYAH